MADVDAERQSSSFDIIAGAQAIKEKTQERINAKHKDGGGEDDGQADLKAELQMTEHQEDLDTLLAKYGTNPETGMSVGAAKPVQILLLV